MGQAKDTRPWVVVTGPGTLGRELLSVFYAAGFGMLLAVVVYHAAGGPSDTEMVGSAPGYHWIYAIPAATGLGWAAFLVFMRSHSISSYKFALADLPDVVRAMTRSTDYPRFAAFVFNTPNKPKDDDAVNLQLSIEDGRLGFDWVLLAPRNVRDRDLFVNFARARGFEPALTRENDVDFLRIESDDPGALLTAVVTDMYGLPANIKMEIIVMGFIWPPKVVRPS